MGGYGHINSESTGAVKTLYLRDNKEEAYSILLAHFEHPVFAEKGEYAG